MTFNMNSSVQVTQDADGKVRELQHHERPYSATDAALPESISPRQLAERYLQDVAGIYEFQPSSINAFAVAEQAPVSRDSELLFREEKSSVQQAIVSFDQTYLGLPVWQAGVTVRMKKDPQLEVSGSQNEYHYGIEVPMPNANTDFLPDQLDAAVVSRLLKAVVTPDQVKINGRRSLVYQYDPYERIDPESQPATDEEMFAPEAPPPTLPLPRVPETIKASQH